MRPLDVDALLDIAVPLGYSRVGYRLRSRRWRDARLGRLDGKVALVTGATSGIGLATCEALASLGATLWLAARSEERGERARGLVQRRARGGDVHLVLADMSSLQSVRQLGARFGEHGSLDLLVNNAAVLMRERELSRDGIELTFATNVLGPFLLTHLLRPALARGEPGRVVDVTSGGMYAQRLTVDDLQSERGRYRGAVAYARSKRAQVVLAGMWAQRRGEVGVTVNAMHPGWVDTPGLRASLPTFHRLAGPLLRTPEQGADTIVWLCAASEPAAISGRLWHDRRERPMYRLPRTRESGEERERLWSACASLAGVGA
ncbi:MAG: SDR family NAD(P)-dependent oxidoreductase [Acidobacteriota bacterium]|nr:SDR family NAD(P)-dependent oxidoreductase [Acidobacteriota bacterium]